MVAPPVFAGTVKLSVSCPAPAVAAETPVGAPGTAVGMALLAVEPAEPVPAAFVAVTPQLYEAPVVNPLTVTGVPVALPDTGVRAPGVTEMHVAV
jgi:hypothetical protein